MLIQFRAVKEVSESADDLANILAQADVEDEKTLRITFDVDQIDIIQEAKINGTAMTFLYAYGLWFKIDHPYDATMAVISEYRGVTLAQE